MTLNQHIDALLTLPDFTWREWVLLAIVVIFVCIFLHQCWLEDQWKRKREAQRNLVPGWEDDLDKRCRFLEGQ